MKPKWTALAAGLWSGEAGALDWPRLVQAALDRDLLGPADLKLIRSVAARAEAGDRPGDGPLLLVLGCLAASVRAGALRIPAEPVPLAERLERFLQGLHAGAVAASPEVRALGFAATAAPDLAALARDAAARFTEAREAGRYAAILGAGPDEFKPLIHSGRSLYFQKFRAAEALAGTRLAALLAAPDRPLEAPDARHILDTVLRKFPLRIGGAPAARNAPAGEPGAVAAGAAAPGAANPDSAPLGQPMEFRDGQKLALALGLRKRLTVVSGGPGTGKTSLVANLLRAHVRLPRAGGPGEGPGAPGGRPLRIRLAAPTGRAAQRMSESLTASLASILYGPGPEAAAEAALDAPLRALTGETLHRLLRYQPGRGEFHHGRGRPVPADLVVVDEVSMVDIFLLGRLLDALEAGASLILLGDMDQLPSVEAGAVLADLVPDRRTFEPSGPLRAWLEASLPGEVPAPAAGAPGSARAASPLQDHLVLLDRSHRSEAGILDVTRHINAQDGAAGLEAMLPPALPGMVPLAGPWTLTRLEDGRKRTPGGGCRLLLPPLLSSGAEAHGAFAESQAGERAYAVGLKAWLQSWAAFHYLGHPQDPAIHPGVTLASPRPAAYDALIRRWASEGPAGAALDGSGGDPADTLAVLFAYLDQARVLTFTRKGWHGAEAVNRRLRDLLAPGWDPYAPTASAAFHGAPILVQENDYAQDLFNGEVGVMLRTRGRYQAWFRKDGGYRAYPSALLPRHELAFASTVHKAQGSEFDQVLVILPEAGNRLLFKETLYTAITRARHFAGLYGPREVFLEAVGRKVARESGLREFLSAGRAA